MKFYVLLILVFLYGCASIPKKEESLSAAELTSEILDRIESTSSLSYAELSEKSDFLLVSRALSSCMVANEKYQEMPSKLSGDTTFKMVIGMMGKIYKATLYQLVRAYPKFEPTLKNGVKQGAQDMYQVILRSERTNEDLEELVHSVNKKCGAAFKNKLQSAISLKPI